MARPVTAETKQSIRMLWVELTKDSPVFFYSGMRGPKRSKAWNLKYARLKRWIVKRAKLMNENITLYSDGITMFRKK